LSNYFRCIATAQTCKHTKPFPDPLLWAAQELKVPPENCLMVGDTTVDIRAGKTAGTQTLGVLCGFGEKMELEKIGADLILGSTSDLMNIFKPV
jgi:phosphoglycolate phosphatase-like HAD superfamily hydrolase